MSSLPGRQADRQPARQASRNASQCPVDRAEGACPSNVLRDGQASTPYQGSTHMAGQALSYVTGAPDTSKKSGMNGRSASARQEGTHQVAAVGEDLRGLDHTAAPEHIAVLVQGVGLQHVADGAHQELLADAEVCRAGQGSM